MRKRLIWVNWTLFLLTVEVLIGAFVHDRFIRPFFGDVLVTVLLYAICRCFKPEGWKWLGAWIFLFSVAVEFFQLIPKPQLEGTLLGIIVGTSFDWRDILCYGVGCLLALVVERYGTGKVEQTMSS
ncbi:MAG: DUF2809 domain-containing protein [Oscillospiraceae bacterium]|jgi:hypothetical protein|nr:DUF2809 domain-containing protein [Oscillospiraceae bacterium]